MNSIVNTKRFIIYLWLGLGYLLLWLFADLFSESGTYFQRAVNNTWLVAYLVIINYFLFEYTLPFIRLRWKRMLVMPFLFFGHLMLYSFGLYAWRFFGIGLGLYTQL
ncbi:MAG TPA: hypothetical protein VGC29_10815, partial [Flavisolibacter sp.]